MSRTFDTNVLGNIAILIEFAVYLALYRGPQTWCHCFSLPLGTCPQVYSMLKLHTTDESRIDEDAMASA